MYRILVWRSTDGVLPDSSVSFDATLDLVRSHCSEYVQVTYDQAMATMRFEAGPLAAVPLFVTRDNYAVYFSWKLEELIFSGISISLDVQRARDFVAGRQRYENSTMFEGIFLVTERAQAVFTRHSSEFILPEDAMSLEPRPVSPKANVCGAYMDLLAHTISAQYGRDTNLICELSGGYDSTNLLMGACIANAPDLASYGLILPGAAGAFQQRRRSAAIEIAGVQDHPLTVEGRSFLEHWLDQSRWVNPYDELYRTLIGNALDKVSQERAGSVVLTGIGGDEAFLPVMETNLGSINANAGKVHPFPKALVPESALLAANTRAPMFLDKGMFPALPYCEVDIVTFSERLPNEWKKKRFIQRQSLLMWGMSPTSLERPHPENFEALLRRELARVLPQIPNLSRAVLVNNGVVEREEWARLIGPGLPFGPLERLSTGTRLLTMEMSLRSVLGSF